MAVTCPSLKVILCGDYGVGKTTIFNRFINKSNKISKNINIDHHERKFIISPSEEIKLQLWDTGGLERVAILPNSYYKYADATILVYAINDVESFHSLSQYILDVVNNSHKSKFYICANKIDIYDNMDQNVQIVDDILIQAFRQECASLISKEFKLSANDFKSNDVMLMFQEIAAELNKGFRSQQHIYRDLSIFKLKRENIETKPQSNTYCNNC